MNVTSVSAPISRGSPHRSLSDHYRFYSMWKGPSNEKCFQLFTIGKTRIVILSITRQVCFRKMTSTILTGCYYLIFFTTLPNRGPMDFTDNNFAQKKIILFLIAVSSVLLAVILPLTSCCLSFTYQQRTNDRRDLIALVYSSSYHWSCFHK